MRISLAFVCLFVLVASSVCVSVAADISNAVCTPLLSSSPKNCHIGDTICYSGYVAGKMGACAFCEGNDAINVSICIMMDGYTCHGATPLQVCSNGKKIVGDCIPFEGTAICVNQNYDGTCGLQYSSCQN